MTNASKGLAKALGRSAGGDTVALSEMPTPDLLANLSDEQRAGLAAAFAAEMPKKTKTDSEDDAEGPEGDKTDAEDMAEGDEGEDGKKPGMGKKKAEAAASATPLQSNASIHERIKAVSAAVSSDDACKGKAALALDLLADDEFAGLSASGIVKMLGKGAADQTGSADSQDGALAEMKLALAAQGNSNITATDQSKKSNSDQNAALWDSAISTLPGARKPA